jgi:glycosyltransferase involved in cell wall biosynthesis
MRIIHVVNSLQTSHGGPSRSITALSSALSRRGHDLRVLTHDVTPMVSPEDTDVSVVRFQEQALREMVNLPSSFKAALPEDNGRHTVLHDHGIWLPINHAAAKEADRRHWPRVVSVRGMLSEWALARGRIRKRVAWHVYQRADLENASCIHVTTNAELGELRQAGIRAPAAIIPNGVSVPSEMPTERSETRTVFFLSRIHAKKGLRQLLDAWNVAALDGWKLIIAGPIEDAALGRSVIAESEHNTSVEYVGPIDDADKWAWYAKSDLFVLPTLSENFGNVVAEALASGVPVITTTAAPWRDLTSHQCGWWIEPGVVPLVEALKAATGLSHEERCAMGARGRDLVASKYVWETVAERMEEVYAWLLASGPRPETVLLPGEMP